ncbi:sensor histidine kinase, partial [Tsukamurella pulmonis]
GTLPGPVRLVAGPADHGRVLVVVASLADRDAAVSDLITELAVTLPLVLLAAAVGGYLLAAAALRPVERMRRRAAALAAQPPSATRSGGAPQLLPVSDSGDEIARLGATFNQVLTTQHAALERQRRFVADAGHELRTPLGVLTAELELSLRRPRSREEYAAALRAALAHTERLTDLAADLLTLSQPGTDGGEHATDVMSVVTAVVGRYPAGTITITAASEQTAATVQVLCPPRDLDRILTNLLDNAHRHGRPPITVAVDTAAADSAGDRPSGDRAADAVTVVVADDGDGVAEQFAPRLFERFARADTARTGPGAGLGLAIARDLAQRHGGTLTAGTARDLPDRTAGAPTGLPRGAVFVLTLPRASLSAAS